MVTKSPMLIVKSDIEISKTFPSLAPNEIGSSAPLRVTVSFTAPPVLLIRRAKSPPAPTGPRAMSARPESRPANPPLVRTKTPSPSTNWAPWPLYSIVAETSLAARVVTAARPSPRCSKRKFPLSETSLPPTERPAGAIEAFKASTRMNGPCGRANPAFPAKAVISVVTANGRVLIWTVT